MFLLLAALWTSLQLYKTPIQVSIWKCFVACIFFKTGLGCTQSGCWSLCAFSACFTSLTGNNLRQLNSSPVLKGDRLLSFIHWLDFFVFSNKIVHQYNSKRKPLREARRRRFVCTYGHVCKERRMCTESRAAEDRATVTLNYGTEKKWSSKKFTRIAVI